MTEVLYFHNSIDCKVSVCPSRLVHNLGVLTSVRTSETSFLCSIACLLEWDFPWDPDGPLFFGKEAWDPLFISSGLFSLPYFTFNDFIVMCLLWATQNCWVSHKFNNLLWLVVQSSRCLDWIWYFYSPTESFSRT